MNINCACETSKCQAFTIIKSHRLKENWYQKKSESSLDLKTEFKSIDITDVNEITNDSFEPDSTFAVTVINTLLAVLICTNTVVHYL